MGRVLRHQQGTYQAAPSGSEDGRKDPWQREKSGSRVLSRTIWRDRTGKELALGEGRLEGGPAGRVWPGDKDKDWQRVKIKRLCSSGGSGF